MANYMYCQNTLWIDGKTFSGLLNISYKLSRDMVYCPCPIHDGDKESAFNFYYEGSSSRGNWKCRTHGCEKYFVSSVLGFIRGVLSNQNGWSDGQRDRDKVVSFEKTLEFAQNFVGNVPLLENKDNDEKRAFAKQISIFAEKKVNVGTLTRQDVRRGLSIPAQYYLNRGYDKSTLDEYDVGLCLTKNREMTDRIVVPVYDDEHKYMVGCTGRSQWEKCYKCSLHHNPILSCPSQNQWKYSKWRNCKQFKAESFLYNYWCAKAHILESGVAILVEGPGDVWRLKEAGILNSLALFGSSLKEGQKQCLDRSGAMSLIVLTDNDEAGRNAAKDIYDKCNREYRLFFPKLSGKDVGEMSKDLVTSEISTIIDSMGTSRP